MKKYITSLTIGLCLSFSFAQSINWGTGLETDAFGNFTLVIEDIPKGAEKIGIRKDDIETSVKLRLRKNGIRPSNDESSHNSLSIQILVKDIKYKDGSTIGLNMFSVGLDFFRPINYNSNDEAYISLGSVYENAYWGTTDTKEIVIDNLIQLIDNFSIAYLEANE